MSVSLLVHGKFRNGKGRTAGLHMSANRAITDLDMQALFRRIQDEIIPVFDKLTNVKVSINVSFENSLIKTEKHETIVKDINQLRPVVESARVTINKLVTKQ